MTVISKVKSWFAGAKAKADQAKTEIDAQIEHFEQLIDDAAKSTVANVHTAAKQAAEVTETWAVNTIDATSALAADTLDKVEEKVVAAKKRVRKPKAKASEQVSE